ncbi:golgi SNAP receptor complex member Gos28 [Arctopsyche grandis]|uniref:golgi SNAP receptor complex member Gos28 n=1 Tax=Arctopsyche grandis TaxID=121162 RepID=UPI00406D86EB
MANVGSGLPSNWEDLRKQARNLENDIDVKLVAFSKLGAGGGGSSLQADTVPLLSADDMFETMAMEIQQLINRLAAVNDKMAEQTSSGAAMLHTRQRHREILQDYQQEFRKTQGNWISRREREDLLRGAEGNGSQHIPGGLSRRDQYTKEGAHLHSSHHMVDEQINIAMETREHLSTQRQSFKKLQTRFNDMSNRFPAIHSLIHRINSRKKRDSLIVGIVVGVCTFLMLLYAFN